MGKNNIWRNTIWENPHLKKKKKIELHISEYPWAPSRINLKNTHRYCYLIANNQNET